MSRGIIIEIAQGELSESGIWLKYLKSPQIPRGKAEGYFGLF